MPITPNPMSSKFVLFAQHGWADTNQSIASLSKTLVTEDVPIIAPDLGWAKTWVRIAPLIQHVEKAAFKALQDHPDFSWRIMGHSMGGLIWVELLTRHPEWWPRVHSLTLVGSPIGGSDLGRIIDPLKLGIAIAKDLGTNRRPLAEAIAAHIPTLVVAGDSDGGSDGTVTLECTKVARATFVVLPDIAHASLKNHPLVGKAIQMFWRQPQVLPAEALTPTVEVIQQLRQVPGMTDAHHRDIQRARTLLRLPDGSSLRTWTNGLGVPHVFVISDDGQCLYGGFVGWVHRGELQTTLNQIQNNFLHR
ncbi:MAG: lysophospholipase [Merismopedia sp. SIO2A8]|nr:lysophospholipase [Merismopedia sp. SIO2A8]